MLLGIVFAVISLERLLNATMILSGEDNAPLSVRLLIAFVCGGLAPVLLVFGYLNKSSRR